MLSLFGREGVHLRFFSSKIFFLYLDNCQIMRWVAKKTFGWFQGYVLLLWRMDLLKTFYVYFSFHNSSFLFFRYLKGRWCILVCYDVTTKYPVYCVLMDNINGLQLYLLLLYYDFNKCYYYVDDKESLFYCQIKIKIFSRQMLSHVHCFLFPMGVWC